MKYFAIEKYLLHDSEKCTHCVAPSCAQTDLIFSLERGATVIYVEYHAGCIVLNEMASQHQSIWVMTVHQLELRMEFIFTFI